MRVTYFTSARAGEYTVVFKKAMPGLNVRLG